MKKLLILAALCSVTVNMLAEVVRCSKDKLNPIWKPACTASGVIFDGCQKDKWVATDKEKEEIEKFQNNPICKNIYVR